jgi:predicted nuclease of predicted toxin-antitoxin system
VRLKLDENLGHSVAEYLRERNHDVSTVTEEGLAGADDHDVFVAATKGKRTLLTLDLDFSSPIRFPPGRSSGVIVIRVARPSHSLILEALSEALPHFSGESPDGATWIVEIGRIRVHRPDADY